ncbi:MAG: hypothetical protein A2Y14_04545 [Verrucomicrobia bacterium GWF2_51_19]|nr:MAG: hypothetical protein A2Y14_04545 [Verrucomicrobia bacterium GWF2_51_19]HCJ12517.1 hypothetical protein [Opitutae bacterium]
MNINNISNTAPLGFDPMAMEYKPLRTMHKHYIDMLRSAVHQGLIVDFASAWISNISSIESIIQAVRNKRPAYKQLKNEVNRLNSIETDTSTSKN